MTPDQIEILKDKVSVWKQYSADGNMDMRDYNRRCAAALEALLSEVEGAASAVLAGWRMVPEDATMEMVDAAADAYAGEFPVRGNRDPWKAAIQALLSSVPPPPVQAHTCFECAGPLNGPYCPACNPAQAQGSGWRSMDSAPRDGTVIDLWVDGYRITDAYWVGKNPPRKRSADGWWSPNQGYDGDHGSIGIEPTYWCPLPAAPTPKAGT